VNWKGRKILVTGADGFIGSHLAERLVVLGADVRAWAEDESPFALVARALADGAPARGAPAPWEVLAPEVMLRAIAAEGFTLEFGG